MSITDLILEEAQHLCDDFWMIWDHKTSDYPDIEDATVIKLAIFKATLLTLMVNYVISFTPEERLEQLELLINALRKSEKELRNDPNFQ